MLSSSADLFTWHNFPAFFKGVQAIGRSDQLTDFAIVVTQRKKSDHIFPPEALVFRKVPFSWRDGLAKAGVNVKAVLGHV